MNRRNFFKLLAGAAAIAALAPKLLVAPKQTWVDIKFYEPIEFNGSAPGSIGG